MTTSKNNTMELVNTSTNIGIDDENIQGVATILNRVLADEHIIYIKSRNYHWNIVGPRFQPLHAFLEEQYDELEEIIDELAERVRTIGASAIGTMTEFIQHATLSEQPGDYPDENGMLSNLLNDHETVIRALRKDLRVCDQQHDDMGSSDFLTGLMQKHEKMAWMLRSFLDERA